MQKHRAEISEFINAGRDITDLTPEAFLEVVLGFVMPKAKIGGGTQRLMEHFGSVSAIMEADVSDIAEQLGGDIKAAEFLKVAPDLGRYYFMDRLKGGKRFDSVDEIAEFCIFRYIKDRRESYSVMLLDASLRMLGIEKLAEGTACEVELSLEALGSALFRYGAQAFILIHNHPGAEPNPSDADVALTERLYAITMPFGKQLMEHIIISGNNYLPIMQLLRKNGYDFYSY